MGNRYALRSTDAALAAASSASDHAAALAQRRVDPLAGSGWTTLTPSGGATASWASGPARLALSVPDGATGGVSVERADFVPTSHEWDALLRLDVTAGDANADTRFILYVGEDDSDVYSYALWTNGNLEAGRVVGGAFTNVATVSGPDAGQRTGGQLWMWLSRRPGHVDTLWGVGSGGALPTVWNLIAHDTAAASVKAASGTYGRISHVTLAGVAGGFGVDVLAIRSKGGAQL